MPPIEWSARRDPGGKPVDRVPAPRRLWVWSYDPAPENERGAVQALVVELLFLLAQAGNRRVREREFVVWWGETVSLGQPIRTIGLPERFDHRAARVLQPLVRLAGQIDHGAYAFADANAAPLAAYDRGRVVTYTDAFASPGSVGGAELRSAEVVLPAPPALAREPLSRLPARHGPLYSLERWHESREEVLDSIGALIGPSSYASLHAVITEDLGITVETRPAAALGAFGRVRTGWLEPLADEAPAVPVRIELQRGLPTALRYVVLAHELAHFLLHFPVLLVDQLVEQISWDMPVVEEVWEARLASMLPPHDDLERNADQLAVNLLIPPRWFPLERMAGHMTHTGFGQPDPRHLIWHFLQALFPDTAGMEFSWHNWEEHERRAAAQIRGQQGVPLDGQTLFGRMLSAALANEDATATALQERVGTAIAAACIGMLDALVELTSIGDTARGARAEQMLDELSGRARPELPQELVGLSGDRRLLAALTGDPRARRLPLIPKRTRWACPLRPDLPADLATWRRRYPDHAMVLYCDPPPLP